MAEKLGGHEDGRAIRSWFLGVLWRRNREEGQPGLYRQTGWADGGESGSDGNAANADLTGCRRGRLWVHDTGQEKQEGGTYPAVGLPRDKGVHCSTGRAGEGFQSDKAE